MTLSSLITRHKNLSKKVMDLENQRSLQRTFQHKSKLIDLKKEKLKIKEQIDEWND